MEVPVPRAADGFVEDVARALAASARRRPIVWTCALGVTAVFAMSSRNSLAAHELAWSMAATYFATALIARAMRGRLPSAAAEAALALAIAIGFAIGPWFQAQTWIARLAALGIVVWLGCGTGNRIGVVIASMLAAVTLTPPALRALFALGSWRQPADFLFQFAAWASVLVLIVAARRRRWLSVVPLAMAAAAWFSLESGRYFPVCLYRGWDRATPVATAVGTFVAAASMFLLVVAVRAAAALDDLLPEDASTRLVVRIQQCPWRSSMLAFTACLASFDVLGDFLWEGGVFVLVALVASLAQISATWSLVDRLAALLVTSATAAVLLRLRSEFDNPDVALDAMAAIYVPVACAVVVGGARTARFPWWGWMGIVGLVALSGRTEPRLAWVAWCVAASLAVHAVVTSGALSAIVLAVSLPVSVAASHWLFEDVPGTDLWTCILNGPIAAIFALAARRVRSMTAVPEDHPVFDRRPCVPPRP